MKPKELKRVLFVGIGGGNDAFSAILAAECLWDCGWRWQECAFAGVASPFHTYSTPYGFVSVPGFHQLTSDSKRFVTRSGNREEISFIDATIANLLERHAVLGGQELFSISLAEGSEGVAGIFKNLADIYDYFVLVDVGGDCFYRGAPDTHVLSPMFDALLIKGFVDSKKEGILFETGPGTDGELEPEALEQALQQTGAQAFPLPGKIMEKWASQYSKWVAPVRTGRTVPTTIEAFSCPDAILTKEYKARAHMGTTRLYASFTQHINTNLCRQFFLLDPSRIENPFAVTCNSPYAWFHLTQVQQQRTNCEANLEYLDIGGHQCQFLTPSPLFPEADRLTLLTQGLQELQQGVCEVAFMFPEDWEMVSSNWKESVKTENDEGLLCITMR